MKQESKLTVIDIFIKDGRRYANCICACGRKSVHRFDNIKNGQIKSCGKCDRENWKRYNLEGNIFGELVVLKYIGLTKHRGALYLCRCSCGNEIEIPAIRLRKGDNKTCGRCTNCRYTIKDDYVIGRNIRTNYIFYFDRDMLEKLRQYSWSSDKNGYMVTKIHDKHVKMHRMIMDAPNGWEVDHIEINKKNDNRRSNLRIATHQQNIFNHAVTHRNKTGYKGVQKVKNKYKAILQYNGKVYHLGTYKDAVGAAIAYNVKAKEFFGEFAWLNPVGDCNV